jgi:hypothetical protein
MQAELVASSKNKFAVSLLRYNKLRSKVIDAEIAVVEGRDDIIFYSAVFSRNNLDVPEIFFQANGKDNVLSLRGLLARSKEPSLGVNFYFVDADFDGLKGHPPGCDLYVTPTYSIENILVSRDALRKLLNAEFGLGTAELIDDRDHIVNLFDIFLQQYSVELKEANRIIHCVRRESLLGNDITNGSIEENCDKFANINHGKFLVEKNATGDVLSKLIKVKGEIKYADFQRHSEDFDRLDPQLNWRGKFLLYLFRRFVSILIEDRNSANPRFFSAGKGKISFDTNNDTFIRTLASICNVPECLVEFIGGIKQRTNKLEN